MANKIVLKKSAVIGKVPLPADLDYGELALNYAEGKVYYKNSINEIAQLNPTSTSGGSSTISVEQSTYAFDGLGGDNPTYTYNTFGQVTSITDTIFSSPRITTLSYNPDSTVNTMSTIFNDTTQTITYAYVNGKLSGFTRSTI